MSDYAAIHALAKEPMTEAEKEAYVRAIFLGHRNTHPYIKHVASRFNSYKAKTIIASLPGHGARLLEYVQNAGVGLIDYKVVQFAHIVRSQTPQIIYEFGAGGSTGLFAELLHENYQKYGIRGELHSFEQSEDYYRRISDAFPEELKPYLFFHLCDVQYARVSDFRLLSYKKPHLHHPVIDLVYIDGPDHIYDGMHYTHYPFFNGDIINLIHEDREIRHAVNDGRWFNMPVYERLLPSYRCTQLSRFKSFTLVPA